MARFCFFTDPAKLAAQQPAQVFGAISADAFNVTDLHSASGDAIAVAVCDGQLRVQEDTAGNLTLILKPDSQPPFDFPFISYFLYKGIDPDSLLVGGTVPKEADAAGKELAKVVWKTWQVNGNQADPDETALGLQFRSTSADYADDQPIDRLFYGYTKEYPPIRVDAGDRLAKFDSTFGFEILVEQMDRPPLLGLARSFPTILSARPAGGSAPNDARSFLRGHDKEAVLGFVDPCVFWGSFLPSKLRASELPGSQKTKGEDIYADILVGPGGGAFANRNRAYLDLRDEHGHSLNYYKAVSVGTKFEIGVEDEAPTEVDYYDAQAPYYGWPCYWLGLALPTSANPPDEVMIRLALPMTDYSLPLIYVSAGSIIRPRGARKLRRRKEQERFLSRPKREDSPYLEPSSIGVPVTTEGGMPRFHASYQKLSHFKRRGTPGTSADPLAPVAAAPLDYVLPIPRQIAFPTAGGKTLVKTLADRVMVEWPSATSSLFVARPGYAADAATVYLFLLPTARFPDRKAKRHAAGPAVFQEIGDFLPAYLNQNPGGPLVVTELHPVPPQGTTSGPVVQAPHELVRGCVVRERDPRSDFLAIALPRAALEAALPSGDPFETVLAGSGLLSLHLSEPRQDSASNTYVEARLDYSRLVGPIQPATGDTVVRSNRQALATVYAFEDLR